MNIRQFAAGILVSFALIVSTVVHAGAEQSASSTVSITGNAGGLSVSITAGNFGPVNYSFSDQTAAGSMTVRVVDQRGTRAGWTVQLSASDFTGGPNGASIDNARLTLTPGAVSTNAGNTNTSAAAQTIAAPFTASGPTQIWSGNAGYGDGDYSMPVASSLSVPGLTLVGTYSSVVTVAVASGP